MRAPGVERLACVTGALRRTWPSRKAQRATPSEITSTTVPKTSTLARSTRGRRGAAANVARIVPVEYSLLMTITPSTPSTSWQKKVPTRLSCVGLSVALLTADIVDQCARVSAVARPEIPMPITTVRPSVHIVERTRAQFRPLTRTRSTIPYRPAEMAPAASRLWSP